MAVRRHMVLLLARCSRRCRCTLLVSCCRGASASVRGRQSMDLESSLLLGIVGVTHIACNRKDRPRLQNTNRNSQVPNPQNLSTYTNNQVVSNNFRLGIDWAAPSIQRCMAGNAAAEEEQCNSWPLPVSICLLHSLCTTTALWLLNMCHCCSQHTWLMDSSRQLSWKK